MTEHILRTKVLDTSEWLALAYLAAPVVIFCSAFLITPLAIPGALVLSGLLVDAGRRTRWSARTDASSVLIALASLAWIVLAGATPFTGQASDWLKTYALLNALHDSAWPAVYEGQYLRSNLAFFIVPSLVVGAARDAAISLIVLCGVWLGLRLLTKDRTLKETMIITTTLIFFSGLDYIATIVWRADPVDRWHFEWWAGFGTISSPTTMLSWSPQHFIPTLIGLAFCLRTASVRHDGLLIVSLLLWSPLTALGLMPFFIARWLAADLKDVLAITNLVAIPLALIIAHYLQQDSGQLPKGFIFGHPRFSWGRLLTSYLFEWGILAIAIWHAGTRHIRWMLLCIGCLVLVPLYYLGAANDFMMRCTAPAIIGLALIAAETLADAPLARTVPLLVILTLGSSTPIGEFGRTARSHRIKERNTLSIATLPPWMLPQYLSRRPIVIRQNSALTPP